MTKPTGKARPRASHLTACWDPAAWPEEMRVIVRMERPHPGAQLRFTDIDGHRFTCIATDAEPRQLTDLEFHQPDWLYWPCGEDLAHAMAALGIPADPSMAMTARERMMGGWAGSRGGWLTWVCRHLGDHRRARDHYQQAVRLFSDLGDRYKQAGALIGLGGTQPAGGGEAAARICWQQALAILGHPLGPGPPRRRPGAGQLGHSPAHSPPAMT